MILDTQVSWFKSTYKTEVAGTVPIIEILNNIKCGQFRDEITKLRNGDETVKQNLETYACHGVFSFNRKASNFIESSGLIILDFDDIDEEVTQEPSDAHLNSVAEATTEEPSQVENNEVLETGGQNITVNSSGEPGQELWCTGGVNLACGEYNSCGERNCRQCYQF